MSTTTSPEIASLESIFQGTAVKVYNATLGYCILQTPAGFEVFNEFGFVGRRATQAEAEALYASLEKGRRDFCRAHNC